MHILVVITLLLGSGLRLLHLIVGDHYHLLSPDSYWFDHQADLLRAGASIGVLKSGLIYPLAYLPGTAYWLPIALYLISALLVYWFVRHFWGVWAALISVVAWTLIPEISLISSAGWVDRDMLMGILAAIAGVIYVVWAARFWAPVAILSIMVVMAIFWVPFSAWMMTGLIGVLLIAKLIAYRSWRIYASYITAGCVLVTAILITLVFDTDTIGITTRHGQFVSGYSETDAINVASLITSYGFWLPIISIGVYQALRSQDKLQVQLAIWFIGVFVAAFVAQRLILFAIFPASVLSGLLIYRAFAGLRNASIRQIDKTRLMAIFSGAMVVVVTASILQIAWIGKIAGISPNTDWQDALSWLRNCDDCTVASHWNYHYWVMDLAKQDTISCDHYYCPGADYVIMPADVINQPELPIAYQNEGVIVYEDGCNR